VEKGDALGHRPLLAGGVADGREAADGFLFVRLVREAVHTFATFGVVPHHAEEHDDGTAARRGRPRCCRVDGERFGSDGNPRGAVIGREHAAIVVKALRPRSGDRKR
jgi:hypothetical protein